MSSADTAAARLAELRAAQHAKFMRVPAEERPRVDPCAECGELPFVREVCPRTGLFHELEKKKKHLIGGKVVTSRVVESSELMEAIDRTIVRWADSRTKLVRVDADAISIFETFVAQFDWKMQRYGVLYGTYDAASKTVEAHAIYEPEQVGYPFHTEPRPDERQARVDAIARGLGLRRVGLAVTQPARDQQQVALSGRELLWCAREQSVWGDECVLLALTPGEDGGVACHAWQASPQCVQLYRLGLLREPETTPDGSAAVADHPALRADAAFAKYVYAEVALEVAEDRTDERGRVVSHQKAPSHYVDARWFTGYIAIEQFESPVVRNKFARISRPGHAPPTFANLRQVIESPARKDQTFAQKIADFHILIFLAETFSMEDDMPQLVQVAKEGAMTETARNYEAIVNAYMQQQQ